MACASGIGALSASTVTMALPVVGAITANNAETLLQRASQGVGNTRLGAFSIAGALDEGRRVPLLESFNPRGRKSRDALFIGAAATPARVRVSMDFLAEKLCRERSDKASPAV